MSGITIPTLDEITGHTVMAKLRSLCKRFIGLAEEVDEKIDAPLEEAHLAVETANATLATAQDALEDAQDAVTTANSASETANSAVETANDASESAQESATTVAGYNTRLTAVENGKINITDINNYAVGLTGNQNDILGRKRIPESDRLKSIINGETNYFNSAYEIDVDQNAIGCVFEIYDRSGNSYGVYYSIMRAYGISLEKLYGNMGENRVAVALSADRTKMYIFVYSNRANLDVRYCVHAWDPNHIANIIRVNNTISETVETLVTGSTYYAVIKI